MALLGVLPGIGIAVALPVLNVFRRAWWPYQAVLGRAAGLAGYHDMRAHPDAERLPGLVLFRFDAPLIFANARVFREQIRRLTRTDSPTEWIVVAAEPIADVDTTAADILVQLDQELNAQGIALVFAEMKTPVRTKVDRHGLTRTINPELLPHRPRTQWPPTGCRPVRNGAALIVAEAHPSAFIREMTWPRPGAVDAEGSLRR